MSFGWTKISQNRTEKAVNKRDIFKIVTTQATEWNSVVLVIPEKGLRTYKKAL